MAVGPKTTAKLNPTCLFINCQTFPLLELLNWTHMHKIKPKNSWKKSKNAFIHWEVDFLLQMCDSKRGTGIISLKHFFPKIFFPVFLLKVLQIISLYPPITFFAPIKGKIKVLITFHCFLTPYY